MGELTKFLLFSAVICAFFVWVLLSRKPRQFQQERNRLWWEWEYGYIDFNTYQERIQELDEAENQDSKQQAT